MRKHILAAFCWLLSCSIAAAQIISGSPNNLTNPVITGTITMTGTAAITGLVMLNGWAPRFAASRNSAAATPSAVGSGYVAGDTITLSTTGGNCTTATVISVITVSGSAIAKWAVQNPGVCTTIPTQPQAQNSTSGSGLNATFTLTYDPIAADLLFAGAAVDTAENTMLGNGAGVAITTGTEITAYGYSAAHALTTATEGAFFGWQAGVAITSGGFNTALGNGSLLSESTGGSNTAVGADAAKFKVSAQPITAVGANAAKNVVRGDNWNIFGAGAALNWNQSSGSQCCNIVIGDNAFVGNTNAVSQIQRNIIIGVSAVPAAGALTGLADNVFIGHSSGALVTGAKQSVVIGKDGGAALTTGNITAIGYQVAPTNCTTSTNVLLLGTSNAQDCSVAGASNQIHIGAGGADVFSVTGTGTPSTSVTTIAGLATITGAATLSASLSFATVADSTTAPTIASGGCTTGSAQSIVTNGTAFFDITLGGATCGSTITLTLPAATTKWHCSVDDVTTPTSNEVHQTGAASTTAVVLTNFVRTTGVAGNFTAADHLVGSCRGG